MNKFKPKNPPKPISSARLKSPLDGNTKETPDFADKSLTEQEPGTRRIEAKDVKRPGSYFKCTAEEAMPLIEKVCKKILDSLPKEPLHIIPWEAIISQTDKVLSEDPAFYLLNKGGGCEKFEPLSAEKEHLYSSYEIGNYLLCERLISELKAKGLLPQELEGAFRKAYYVLYDNPPSRVYIAQLNAFEELIEKIGEEKAERLFAEAYELAIKQSREISGIPMPPAIGDMFRNPAYSTPFSYWKFGEDTYGLKGKTSIEKFRFCIQKMSGHDSSKFGPDYL